MIELHSWPTPNGLKVSIFLEEAEMAHTVFQVNIGAGDQFNPAFLAMSPNNRIPAILDRDPADGGAPLSVFESGAILVYLADKTGKFLSRELRTRTAQLEWLFWQVGGLGPMAGQNHHFNIYAPEKIPYAMERYVKETARLYGVLNKHLEGRDYVEGDFSIADMAIYPWVVQHENQQQNLSDFPHLKIWFERVAARPGVQRAYDRVTTLYPDRKEMTDEEKKLLFNLKG